MNLARRKFSCSAFIFSVADLILCSTLNLFIILIYTQPHNIMPKKVLILTGGGDCPGLNAVIRGIAKRARREKDWEVYGSIEAFNGVLNEPQEIVRLTSKRTAGIHIKGGTILK